MVGKKWVNCSIYGWQAKLSSDMLTASSSESQTFTKQTDHWEFGFRTMWWVVSGVGVTTPRYITNRVLEVQGNIQIPKSLN